MKEKLIFTNAILMKTAAIRKASTFDELLDIKYGKIGTPERDEYKAKANIFLISGILKEVLKHV